MASQPIPSITLNDDGDIADSVLVADTTALSSATTTTPLDSTVCLSTTINDASNPASAVGSSDELSNLSLPPPTPEQQPETSKPDWTTSVAAYLNTARGPADRLAARFAARHASNKKAKGLNSWSRILLILKYAARGAVIFQPGTALIGGGPLGLLLGYLTISSIFISLMHQTCELVAFSPGEGAYLPLVAKFADPALLSMVEWTYLLYSISMVIVGQILAEQAAWFFVSRNLVNHNVSTCLASLVILVSEAARSVWSTRIDVYLVSVKVVTVFATLVCSLTIAFQGTRKIEPPGFSFWIKPGPFHQYNNIPGPWGRFLGFCSVLQQALWSSLGAEMMVIALTEGDEKPRRAIPVCTKVAWLHESAFVVPLVLALGMIISSNDEQLRTRDAAVISPFILAFDAAGIKVVPTLIAIGVALSSLSEGATSLQIASHCLVRIAKQKQLPQVFSQRRLYAVLACWMLANLTYLAQSSGTSKIVFDMILCFQTISGALIWMTISVVYLRFRNGMRAQGKSRKRLSWQSPIAFLGAYWNVTLLSLIVVFSGWQYPVVADKKLNLWYIATNYLPLVLFPVGYLFFKFIFGKTEIVKFDQMDFDTALVEIDAERLHQKGHALPVHQSPQP